MSRNYYQDYIGKKCGYYGSRRETGKITRYVADKNVFVIISDRTGAIVQRHPYDIVLLTEEEVADYLKPSPPKEKKLRTTSEYKKPLATQKEKKPRTTPAYKKPRSTQKEKKPDNGYVVKVSLNKLYCEILKDGVYILDERGQPKRFSCARFAREYVRCLEAGVDMNWTDEKIVAWHKETFPYTTISEQLLKLEEELKKVVEAQKNGEKEHSYDEMADVYIVCTVLDKRFDSTTGRYFLGLIKEHPVRNIKMRVCKKMNINAKRTWKDNKHVEE